jgi:hypothetical protein
MTITRIERNEKKYKVTKSVFCQLFSNKSWRGKNYRNAETQLTGTPRECSFRQLDYLGQGDIRGGWARHLMGSAKCRCHSNGSMGPAAAIEYRKSQSRYRNIVINEIKSHYRSIYLVGGHVRDILRIYTHGPHFTLHRPHFGHFLRLKHLKLQDSPISIISIDRLVPNRNNSKLNDCIVAILHFEAPTQSVYLP